MLPNHVHLFLGKINNSKLFAGFVMILLNIGSRFVKIEVSKSQEKYKLTIYNSTITVTDTTINSEPPRNGTWLFPAILDQRDLIIIW